MLRSDTCRVNLSFRCTYKQPIETYELIDLGMAVDHAPLGGILATMISRYYNIYAAE